MNWHVMLDKAKHLHSIKAKTLRLRSERQEIPKARMVNPRRPFRINVGFIIHEEVGAIMNSRLNSTMFNSMMILNWKTSTA